MDLKRELLRRRIVKRRDIQTAETRWQKSSPIPSKRQPFSKFLTSQYPENFELLAALAKLPTEERLLLETPDLDQILDEIRGRRVILFVGAGFSAPSDPAGEVLTGNLVRDVLAKNLVIPEGVDEPRATSGTPIAPASYDLEEIAEHFERVRSRDMLHTRLASLCNHHLPRQPLDHHRILASLDCFRFIVTTNWDRLIEKAFADAAARGGAPLHVITRGDQIRALDFSRITLLKVHGDFDESTGHWSVPPRITGPDLRNLEFDEPAVFNLLQALTLTHRILVVGFHPSDYTLTRLIQHALVATRSTNQPSRTIAIVDPSREAPLHARFHKPIPIRTDAERFFDVVKDFIDNEGRTVGSANRDATRNAVGPQIWAPQDHDLANQLLQKFECLRHVEVVNPQAAVGRAHDPASAVARRAGRLLRDFLPRQSGKLTFSCGSTLKRMVEMFDSRGTQFDDLEIYSTTIPLSDDCDITSPFGLVTLMADRVTGERIRARAYQLPATFADHEVNSAWARIFPDAEPLTISQAPMTTGSGLQSALTGADKYLLEAAGADVFCLGIGAIDEQTTALGRYARACLRACHEQGYDGTLENYMMKFADKQGLVGDLMYRLFRPPISSSDPESMFMTSEALEHCLQSSSGDERPISTRFGEFMLRFHYQVKTISPRVLYEATAANDKIVMFVAHGAHKADALKALLRGGFSNVLVVDRALAHELVQ